MSNKYLEFSQYNVPNLKSARYKLTIQQHVTTPSKQTFTRSYTFDVSGDRFSLATPSVHAVFPANGSRGAFDAVLPHITLNRTRFPWLVQFNPNNEYVPWVAVLLFDEAEQPTLTQGTVKDLVSMDKKVQGFDQQGQPTAAVSGALPDDDYYSHFSAIADETIMLNVSESPNENCAYIDVPADVFNTIAPSAADVAYLAQVRHVATSNKPAQQQHGDYVTIVSNRIPQLGKRTIAHLVSLDGLYNIMPKDTDYSPQLPEQYTRLRLVSLHSWTFDAVDDHHEFVEALATINLGTEQYKPGTLIYPLDTTPPSHATFQAALKRQETGTLQAGDAELLIQYAIAMGYMTFQHQTRQGGQTVSWYRGPLTSYEVQQYLNRSLPATGPDALTGYNTATGLFDVSYASAWQLGQLLALSDKPVAQALHQWKRQIREAAITIHEKQLIDHAYLSGNRLKRAIDYIKQFTRKQEV